jgi:translocation and assembly module TamA
VGVVDEETRQSLPESKYFFAGGSFSNRAYGFRELGVIISPTEDTIYGAATWANLTLEAFSGEIITSAGAGVRYMTPIGPFKLDVGMNVADPSQYGISFQIGQSF